jgi:hypothetical protein
VSAVDLFATEAQLPTGETVAIPPELLEAVRAACIIPADDDGSLAAGRDAFMRRFLAELFNRGALVISRGKSSSRETVGLDAYTLVCSQKHSLQARMASIVRVIRGELGLSHGELADAIDELLATLTGHAPALAPGESHDAARRRIGHQAVDIKNRVEGIRRLALGLPPIAAPMMSAPIGEAAPEQPGAA